ncbi:hypothetical protein [Acetobacterium sp.]|uniref:hypothetical protein n=1 Tax=Acetobacterium sp. TaxID=1872094 RepID=UPI00271C528A|nr:hypothetical protein [Acetobacterium sp.]MDO9493994.1 hypothetical protein [Acetobacterium sp.]
MNQLTLNNYFTLSDLENAVTKISHNISRTQIKQVFEQPQKTCLKFLKSLWSDVNIENHCDLTNIDFNEVKKSEDILIPETIDNQCQECLNASKHKLSTFEQLFLSNYNLAMNDFEDGKIKESFSSYDHYL